MPDIWNEPPVDPLDDTSPSLSMRPVGLDQKLAEQADPDDAPDDDLPMWRRAAGVLSLIGAMAFTLATLVLFSAPRPTPAVVSAPTSTPTTNAAIETSEVIATFTPPPPGVTAAPLPTVPPDLLPQLIAQAPLTGQMVGFDSNARDRFNPFTIVSDRPRSEISTYTVQRGDTISAIALRFGLAMETIAWANDRRIVWYLRPGEVINIPPVDGYLHIAIGNTLTIADIVTQYSPDGVTIDPWVVLDHPANSRLTGMTPETIPPPNSPIFIPGGQGESIVWTPNVERSGSTDASGRTITTLRFAAGEPGDCGSVPLGGGTQWINPLPSGYTFMRGFTGVHTGVDLAAPEGTPVVAANGGTVIYAGWSNWGYGYTVVLSHGPTATLYGHMSAISASCGATVAAGQVIGAVGNTGNSTGPHLHFEIRGGDALTPYDPTSTIPF